MSLRISTTKEINMDIKLNPMVISCYINNTWYLFKHCTKYTFLNYYLIHYNVLFPEKDHNAHIII